MELRKNRSEGSTARGNKGQEVSKKKKAKPERNTNSTRPKNGGNIQRK
jgi:hypothetical protein